MPMPGEMFLNAFIYDSYSSAVVSVPLHLKSVSCSESEIWSQGCKTVSIDCGVLSETTYLTVSWEPASNPMVFCFLPGTRPASVTFCMTSACHVTDSAGLNLPTVSVAIVIEMLLFFFISLIDLLLSFMFQLRVGFCWLVGLFCTPAVLGLHCVLSLFCPADPLRHMCRLLSQLQYLPPPWGDCKSTPIDSEYFSTYSISACRIDCETRYLLENCNCRMVHMPGMSPEQVQSDPKRITCLCNDYFGFSFWTGTSTVCTPEQYKDCADPALGEHLYCRN